MVRPLQAVPYSFGEHTGSLFEKGDWEYDSTGSFVRGRFHSRHIEHIPEERVAC